MPKTGTNREDRDKKRGFILCELCAFSSRTVYSIEDEDEPWKKSKAFEDFDCNNQSVHKYYGLKVAECEGFELFVKQDKPQEPEKEDHVSQFELKLLRQRLNSEIADLRTQVKKLNKKRKSKKRKK